MTSITVLVKILIRIKALQANNNDVKVEAGIDYQQEVKELDNKE